MVPALVKLGMEIQTGEHIANMFADVTSERKHNFHPFSAQGSNSDCYLKPVRIFPDPFRCDPHILVLCEVLDSDKNPAATNHRFSCNKTMTKGTGFTTSIRSSEIIRSVEFKGSADLSPFIFGINVGNSRIRHRTTLKSNF